MHELRDMEYKFIVELDRQRGAFGNVTVQYNIFKLSDFENGNIGQVSPLLLLQSDCEVV